jgi:hypothetical protein
MRGNRRAIRTAIVSAPLLICLIPVGTAFAQSPAPVPHPAIVVPQLHVPSPVLVAPVRPAIAVAPTIKVGPTNHPVPVETMTVPSKPLPTIHAVPIDTVTTVPKRIEATNPAAAAKNTSGAAETKFSDGKKGSVAKIVLPKGVAGQVPDSALLGAQPPAAGLAPSNTGNSAGGPSPAPTPTPTPSGATLLNSGLGAITKGDTSSTPTPTPTPAPGGVTSLNSALYGAQPPTGPTQSDTAAISMGNPSPTPTPTPTPTPGGATTLLNSGLLGAQPPPSTGATTKGNDGALSNQHSQPADSTSIGPGNTALLGAQPSPSTGATTKGNDGALSNQHSQSNPDPSPTPTPSPPAIPNLPCIGFLGGC